MLSLCLKFLLWVLIFVFFIKFFLYLVSQHFRLSTHDEVRQNERKGKGRREKDGEENQLDLPAETENAGECNYNDSRSPRTDTCSLPDEIDGVQKSLPNFALTNLKIPIPSSNRIRSLSRSRSSSPPIVLSKQRCSRLFITNPSTIELSDTEQTNSEPNTYNPPEQRRSKIQGLQIPIELKDKKLVGPVQHTPGTTPHSQNPWITSPVYDGPVYEIREADSKYTYVSLLSRKRTGRKVKKLVARLSRQFTRPDHERRNTSVTGEEQDESESLHESLIKEKGSGITVSSTSLLKKKRTWKDVILVPASKMSGVEELRSYKVHLEENEEKSEPVMLERVCMQDSYAEERGLWKRNLRLGGLRRESDKRKSILSLDGMGNFEACAE